MRFWKKRREEKLYKQWVQHSGLPSESIPQREEVEVGRIRGEERDRLRPYKEKLVAVIRKLLKV
ncbi:MAG: hypothetical protein KAT53_05900 [Dehalococcoidia bacterium]|nr:hypothetical protein [Dehalococcoidia bacterium]